MQCVTTKFDVRIVSDRRIFDFRFLQYFLGFAYSLFLFLSLSLFLSLFYLILPTSAVNFNFVNDFVNAKFFCV